jgi:3-oxoacyl-[acyl-carrier protein] reductase
LGGAFSFQLPPALYRAYQPDDVASVIAFLVSDEARWITGDTVAVDGGSKL